MPVDSNNSTTPVTEVTFTPLASRLEIRIRDCGAGVDLDKVPNPNLPENLLKPNGRGVFFMKQVMDQVLMEKDPQGSTLVLVKNRRAGEPTEA